MRLPWQRRKIRLEPTEDELQRIEEERERERKFQEWEAAYREEQKRRLERMALIPENLEGYRLSRGCTCRAEDALPATYRADGTKEFMYVGSHGVYHEPGCERKESLWVNIIEENFPLPNVGDGVVLEVMS